jgi:uncharacterized protein (TIGR02246 family)
MATPAAFLDAWVAASNAGDAAALARLFGPPTLVVHRRGGRILADRAAVEKALAGVVARWAAQGIARHEACAVRIDTLGHDFAEIHLLWDLRDCTGAPLKAPQSSYILRRAEDGGWRLAVLLEHSDGTGG